ncbi:MAG: glutamine--fructose-6-phosphate transaminase (isomerizing) [Gammaproteobacteria bacterium]|nr:glutamine--fructose-6-phosphate transaminase (isomerizing) [Gammaproteobacteria bacterium]
MCGIVGAVAGREVPAILLEGLQRLEYRGYDSAGIAVTKNGVDLKAANGSTIERRRTIGRVQELAENLALDPIFGTTGIAHTRWATHGRPSVENAHPHMSRGRICLVHNGIVENFEELRSELMDDGYQFDSGTDSEVIAHLIDRCTDEEEDLLEAVRKAVKRLDGAYALGVMFRDDPGRIVGVRVGSPLVVGVGIGENFIASDALALRPVTDRFIYLEQGDLVDITPRSISIWNVNDRAVVRSTVRVEHSGDAADKGEYRHHMEKEIHEQPRAIRDTLEGRLGGDHVLEPAFGIDAKRVLDDTRSVTIAACGTAYYAGCIARYWIEELAGIPTSVEIASEFRYRKFVTPPGGLFMTISQSGETADTLAAHRIAKSSGFEHTLTVCNVPTSTQVRESDLAVLTQAGVEICVASTKAFTTQLAALFMVAILLARRTGISRARERELVDALRALPEVVEQTLALEERIDELAIEFMHRHHALFLGRGAHYPVALEGALKLKEISYIHAEGYPAGELKHGPLALVDEDMPVVAVAPGDELVKKVRSNLQEVRARGGRLYVFADADAGIAEADGVTVIEVPKVHELLAPVVYTVPLQLLAYHTAVLKGTDVDQPRNLAKSVTVE